MSSQKFIALLEKEDELSDTAHRFRSILNNEMHLSKIEILSEMLRNYCALRSNEKIKVIRYVSK